MNTNRDNRGIFYRFREWIFLPIIERLNRMATKEEIKSMIDTAVDKVTTAASEAINRATADLTQAINDAKGGAIQIEDVQPAVDKLNTLATTLDNLDIYNPEQPVPPTE